jgi:hypothetical protein
MTTLTIYTPDYDNYEDVVNDGMSNKAFLDIDNQLGIPFNSISAALVYLAENNIPVHSIEINYVDDKNKIQMFHKFNVAQ